MIYFLQAKTGDIERSIAVFWKVSLKIIKVGYSRDCSLALMTDGNTFCPESVINKCSERKKKKRKGQIGLEISMIKTALGKFTL